MNLCSDRIAMDEEEKRVRRCNTMSSNWSDLHVELLIRVDPEKAWSRWHGLLQTGFSIPIWRRKILYLRPGLQTLAATNPMAHAVMLHQEPVAGHFFSLSQKKVYIFNNLFRGFRDGWWIRNMGGWWCMWNFEYIFSTLSLGLELNSHL